MKKSIIIILVCLFAQTSLAQSPGIEIGRTYYDCQSVGASGDRIAVCDDGSRYLCWTNLLGWPYPPAPCHVWSCWISPDGSQIYSGQLSRESSFSAQVDVINGNQGAFTYWALSTDVTLTISNTYDPPGKYSPRLTVDRNNNIHILSSDPTIFYLRKLNYTNSTDGGNTWFSLQQFDLLTVMGYAIDASAVSDRVAVAYCHPSDIDSYRENDVMILVSEDGLQWDSSCLNNITDYANDDDSLWAYTDLDVIIDYNDFIHVIWNAQWVTDQGIYYRTFLFHYNEQTGMINTITAHPDSSWQSISGAWNRPVCKMSLGMQENANNIYTVWTQFDTSDVSASGYGNGDLYMSYTHDGSNWHQPVNLTNSPTPGCYPGNCDSDNWATLADKVDQDLHIFYVNDKDAGSVTQTEGTATNNPMLYYKYPLVTAIDNVDNMPDDYLVRNYPNPFNASTTINFNIPEPAFVSVKIYDITGSLVAVILDEIKTVGRYNLTWDAAEYSSGLYFVNLRAGEKEFTHKMILQK